MIPASWHQAADSWLAAHGRPLIAVALAAVATICLWHLWRILTGHPVDAAAGWAKYVILPF